MFCLRPHRLRSAVVFLGAAAAVLSASPAQAAPPVEPTPNVTISAGPSGTITTKQPSFSFHSSVTGTEFSCTLDGPTPVFDACFSPWTTPVLADGTYTFTVGGCKEYESEPKCDPSPPTRTFTVDTVAPAATLAGPADGARTNVFPAYTLGGAGQGDTYLCRVQRPDGIAFEDPCTGSFEPWGDQRGGDGTYQVQVRIRDAVGNLGTPAARSFVLDRVAPGTSLTAPETSNDRRPAWTFAPVADGSTSYTHECELDGTSTPCAQSPFRPAADLADGPHTLRVRTVDDVGNAGTWTERTVTIDATAPALDQPAWNASTKTLTWTTDAATTCAVDGGAPAGCTSPLALASLADGSHTVVVRAVDEMGNTTTRTATFTILAPGGSTGDPKPSDPKPSDPKPGDQTGSQQTGGQQQASGPQGGAVAVPAAQQAASARPVAPAATAQPAKKAKRCRKGTKARTVKGKRRCVKVKRRAGSARRG